MPCTTVYEWLQKETGRFDGEIYRRVFPRSPWIAFIRKAPFPDGMGVELNNIQFEPRAPASYVAWANMFNTLSAVGGSCLPEARQVTLGSITRAWHPHQIAIQGPDFCVTDLRTGYQAAAQLEKLVSVLADYAMIEWEMRYRHEYLRLTGLKVVVGAANVYEGTGEDFDSIGECPGSRLTQGVLDRYKMRLLRNGAMSSALATEGGVGVLTLITEPETSDDLIRQNADSRQDIRYAQPSMLLQSIGHSGRVYRGFIHVLDLSAIHYTCVRGTYTEVPPYATVALAGDMDKSVVNPDWLIAPYTTSHIFDPDVFTARIPAPIGSIGPLNFNAVNYVTGAGGSFRLLNIPSRDCNPDGTIVYHRGLLAEGSEPGRPDKGISFAHLRCDPALNLITECS